MENPARHLPSAHRQRYCEPHRHGSGPAESRIGEHEGRNIPQLKNRRLRGSLSENVGTRRCEARTRLKR